MNTGREKTNWKLLISNMAGFQLGWFACVLGAAADNPWIGPLVVGFLCVLYVAVLPSRRSLVQLALFAALLGVLTDSVLILSDIFTFTGASLPSWLSPLWLTAMWVNLALTLRISLAWLLGRYLLSSALGAVSGPLAYYAGARFGAIEFQTSLPIAVLILALVWSVALPLLIYRAGKEES